MRSIQHLTALDQFLEIIYNEWKLENVFYKSNSTEIIKPVLDRFYFVSTALVELGFHPETILEIKIITLQQVNYFMIKMSMSF